MSWAIWITGLPGSGKSVIARAAARMLADAGEPVELLELDVLRRVLTPVPTYDDAERQAVYRALVFIATTLTRAGRPVIIDATAHRREWRDLARASIDDFAEVQLSCPLDVARERERTRATGHAPRGIYAAAGAATSTVPGVDVAYEPALAPELTIDTTVEKVEDAAARVAALGRSLARRPSVRADTPGWTIWVSGRPGSGKSTVISAVCQRLGGRMPVVVLEPCAVADVVAPAGCLVERDDELVARTVVQAAKLLSEAGAAVLIDGTPHRREAVRLARDLIELFAQVELVCPPEIGRARERAVRWSLVPCPGAARRRTLPDLGLDYEPSPAPDLTLYTHVLDEWTAAEEVLRLVDRLERAARERRRPCA